MRAVEQSDVLQQCPPGIHFGHWDYPPHLKDLRFLSSSMSYSSPPRLANHRDYDIVPVFDRYKPQTVRAMQLRLTETCGASATYRTATIGCVVERSGKRFYVAPAHVFSNDAQDMASDSVGLDSDDSDCEFGGFDDQDDNTADDREADFMSQYSVTPESSDVEEEWDFDDGHLSDVDSEDSGLEENVIQSAIVSDSKETWCLPAKAGSITPSASGTLHDSMTLNKLDYCLLEIDDGDKFSLDLPVLSERSVGRPAPGAINVTAFTGSGKLLAGVLSDRRTCIRLPHTTGYTQVLSVEFQHSLRPGDSGSIVRDASTGMIYGHVAAGDTGSQTAFIIPADDMLGDLMANTGDNRTSMAGRKSLDSLAAVNGAEDIVRISLEYSINPNPRASWWKHSNPTPLESATSNGNGAIVKMLLEAGADHNLTTSGRGETWKDPPLQSDTQDPPLWLLQNTSGMFSEVPDLFIPRFPLPCSEIRELLDSLDSFSRLLGTIRDTYLDPDIRRGNIRRFVLLKMTHSEAVAIKRFPPSQRGFESEGQILGRVYGRCIDSTRPVSNLRKAGSKWEGKMVLRVIELISQVSTTLELHSARFDDNSPIILDIPWMPAVSPQHSTDIIHCRRAMRTGCGDVLLAALLSSLPRTFNRQQRACLNAGQCRQLAMHVPLSDVSATVSRFSTICSRGQDISEWGLELSSISLTVPIPGIPDILNPGARYFVHELSVPPDYIYFMSSGFQSSKLGSLHSQEVVCVKKKSPQCCHCCHCNGTFHRRMTILHCLGESLIVNQYPWKLTK